MRENGEFYILKFSEPVKWLVHFSVNITTATSAPSKYPMVEMTIEPKLKVTSHPPVFVTKPVTQLDFTGKNADL
jgi:hypothetical protein